MERPPQPRDNPADRQPDSDSAGAHQHECPDRLTGREAARHRGGQGNPKRNQAGGVIEQALALEHGHDAARHWQSSEDCGRGHGVRRRDDGAQRERHRPVEARDGRVNDCRDHDGRGHHQADRERQNRARMGAEVPY